jgi:hypothetical protein
VKIKPKKLNYKKVDYVEQDHQRIGVPDACSYHVHTLQALVMKDALLKYSRKL